MSSTFPEARDLPCHTGLVLVSDKGSGLGRVMPDKHVQLVRGDRDAFGIHGRSAEQRVALDLLLDPDVGIVSLGGRAGTGKSALAICAGLEAVMERNQHKKVVVFRPLYAVGGQELGYLPGSESEKMGPWAQAVFDTLGAVTSTPVIEEILDRGMLEVLPLTHIRGRSLHDSFVIVDEAQSLERNVLLTVLSRIGANSKVVLTHDVAQRDNLRVGRHDGVVAVVEKLKGHPLFAHVTLTRSERSPVAALVTEMLEDVTSDDRPRGDTPLWQSCAREQEGCRRRCPRPHVVDARGLCRHGSDSSRVLHWWVVPDRVDARSIAETCSSAAGTPSSSSSSRPASTSDAARSSASSPAATTRSTS